MPPQTRSKGQPPASRVYSSTPSLQQVRFPPRRKAIKTYGKRTRREATLRQQTITQIDFLQPIHPEELDELEGNSELSMEPVLEEEEEKKRKKKRRKTEGDEPDDGPPTSSLFTQTLTQFYGDDGVKKGGKGRSRTIKDSEDEDEGFEAVFAAGKRARFKDFEDETPEERQDTKSPSVIPQTPLKKQTRLEIPSSQPSPCTPMLLRYSPLGPRGSPLKARSTNVGSPLPPARRMEKGRIPRTLVIQDSFASAVTISSGPSQSSNRAVKGCDSSSQRIPSSQTRIPTVEEEEETPSEEYGDENEPPESQQEQQEQQERRRPTVIPDSDDETEDDYHGDQTGDDDLSGEKTEVLRSREEVETDRVASSIEGERVQEDEDQYPIGEETQFALDILASGTDLTASPSQQRSSRLSHQRSSQKLREAAESTPKPPRKKPTAVGFSSPQFCPEEEDRHAAQHKTQVYTQMNSQRVDIAIIRAMPPPTDRSDIFISIHPEHVAKIVNGTKDHEFRTWKIPSTVSRIWIYVTKPESMLRYMACIGPAKTPGEIEDETGVGNAEFNKGKKRSGYAYEIVELYELNNPVPLKKMKSNGWVDAAPQKYTYVPPAVVSQLQANLRCQLLLDDDGHHLLGDGEELDSPTKQSATLSQEAGEVEAQLLSDIAYSTQHPTSDDRGPLGSSQKTPRPLRRSTRQSRKTPPAQPAKTAAPLSGSKHRRDGRKIPSSQATTASESSPPPRSQKQQHPGLTQQPTHVSSSPLAFHDSGSPVRVPEGDFDLRTSQLLGASQLLPETLMRDDESGPPAGYDFGDDDL